MNSEFLGLRTSIYKVTDLNKAKEWYEKAFDKKPYFDEPFYVGFNIGGYDLGLQSEEQVEDSQKSGYATVYWGVMDIQKTFQHLLKIGAISVEEPQDVGDDIKVASVKDPWRNIIGIIYNPNFKLSE